MYAILVRIVFYFFIVGFDTPKNAGYCILVWVGCKRASGVDVNLKTHNAHILGLVLETSAIQFGRVFEAMAVLLCWTLDLR
jgi:hypothetical protein